MTLSRKSVTSAVFRAGRVPEPEKITSSMPDARVFLYETFAHHPRQRFDEVRLAAAVRSNDAGQPAFDDELAGSTKDLNPRRRSRKTSCAQHFRAGGHARPRMKQASEHAVDDRRHFRDRQGPFVGVPVDEEVRVESTLNSSSPSFRTALTSSRKALGPSSRPRRTPVKNRQVWRFGAARPWRFRRTPRLPAA